MKEYNHKYIFSECNKDLIWIIFHSLSLGIITQCKHNIQYKHIIPLSSNNTQLIELDRMWLKNDRKKQIKYVFFILYDKVSPIWMNNDNKVWLNPKIKKVKTVKRFFTFSMRILLIN